MLTFSENENTEVLENFDFDAFLNPSPMDSLAPPVSPGGPKMKAHHEPPRDGTTDTRFHSSITISDDQSVANQAEDRKLLALRDKTPAQPETVEDHAVPDYQMQLMLLEQQNKNRLMIARQQTQMQQQRLPQHHMREHREQEFHVNELGKLQKPPSLGPALRSMDGPTVSPSEDAAALGISSSEDDLALQSIPTNPADLQSYICALQAKARKLEVMQESQKPSRIQILYRIQGSDTYDQDADANSDAARPTPYFDPPEWADGQDKFRYLRCNVPVGNFDLFLERNKGVSFIVFHTYHEMSKRNGLASSMDASGAEESYYVRQSIRPVARDLSRALEVVLKSRPEYADTRRHFIQTNEIRAPYLFMFHLRHDLDTLSKTLDIASQTQFNLFKNYAFGQFGQEYAKADALFDQGKVKEEYVQYLFKPGDVMVVQQPDGAYVGRMIASWPLKLPSLSLQTNAVETPSGCEEKRHRWSMQAWHWSFSGEFERKTGMEVLEMPLVETTKLDQNEHTQRFGSHKPEDLVNDAYNITDLNAFPLRFAPNHLVDSLRRRGQTFWKCRHRRFVVYQETRDERIASQSEERYMIDYKTYRSLHHHSTGDLYSSQDMRLNPKKMAMEQLPDAQFELLVPARIKGFNIRIKKWYDLDVDRISDVVWNKAAFKKVVIERKSKDLIQALVSNQIASTQSTDLIAGRGNGLILLLHGSPGTGKTLTAETVAEIAEKPLYRVTCGDVGTQPETAEKYLEAVFHLGKLWDCVVLLDEADVFLEQRSLHDLTRNALVSVFLRVLEYYEGILILTSNRVGTFDEAFKSRIQLALHYPALGPYQRMRIWENFFNRLASFAPSVQPLDAVNLGVNGDEQKEPDCGMNKAAVDIPDLRRHLEDLKEERMNGRQIRNAINTARQYAAWKGTTLNYAALKDVIDVSGRFDRHLDKLENSGDATETSEEEEWLRLNES